MARRESFDEQVVRTGWVAFQKCHATDLVNCKFTEKERACVQPSHQPRRLGGASGPSGRTFTNTPNNN